MVTAKRYSASDALAAGIIAEVAADDAVLDRAITRAQALATKPRHVIAAIEHGLYRNTLDLPLGAAHDWHITCRGHHVDDCRTREARRAGDRCLVLVDDRSANDRSGSTIAHGFLILALAPRLTFEVFGLDETGAASEIQFGVNYGLDKVRFISPLPVNSCVRARVSVLGVQREPNGAKFTLRLTFERDGGDRPVAIADWLQRVFT